jgi:hypothetical protein
MTSALHTGRRGVRDGRGDALRQRHEGSRAARAPRP